MKLYPLDLGQRRGLSLLMKRAGSTPSSLSQTQAQAETTAGESGASIGRWGRAWLQNKQNNIATSGPVSDEVRLALHVNRLALRTWVTLGLLPASAFVGLLSAASANSVDTPSLLMGAGISGFLGWFCALQRPRTLLKRTISRLRDKPLTASEVASLLPLATDELERSYLTLVMDVIRQDVSMPIVPAAGADLRVALQALGDAIDRLPATRAVIGENPDILTEVLRKTAERTLLAAQTETDRVVAASLIRRVEALHRRADAASRTDVLIRRFAALRQEMAAETEALRAGLTAYYTGAHDVADLTRLAEDVRRVAAEASAITAAVEEVDGIISAAPRHSFTPIPAVETGIQIDLGH